jgi:CMP/dCMP kinase
MMTTPHIQIAIDGPVASGKSTVGEAVARALGILYVDANERGVDLADNDACGALAESLPLRLTPSAIPDGRQYSVFVGDRDVTWDLRTPLVDRITPHVAALPRVRAALHIQQRRLAAEQSVVMVGRDIAAIVLPDAKVKIFLHASLDERVRRRAGQRLARDPAAEVDLAQLRAEIAERDREDHQNTLLTPDTIMLDTDGLTIEQVVERIVEVTHERY